MGLIQLNKFEVSFLLIQPKGLNINIIFKGDCCLRKNNTLEIVA